MRWKIFAVLGLLASGAAITSLLVLSNNDAPAMEAADNDARTPVSSLSVASAFTDCQADSSTSLSSCIADTLLDSGAAPQVAISALYEWNTNAPEHGIVCHNVAHYLGQSWSEQYGPAALIGLDSGQCDGGLVHGLVEALAFHADDAVFNSVVPTICNGFTVGSAARLQCAHGAGHALVLRDARDFRQMVAACLVMGIDDQSPCYTAVLMTYANNTGSLATDATPVIVPRIPTAELQTICNEVPESMREKCWEGLWQLHPRDNGIEPIVNELRNACNAATSDVYAQKCEASIGQLLFQTIPHGDTPADIRNELRTAISQCPDDVAERCTSGAAASAVAWFIALYGSTDGYLSVCSDPVVQFVDACTAGENGDSALTTRTTTSVAP